MKLPMKFCWVFGGHLVSTTLTHRKEEQSYNYLSHISSSEASKRRTSHNKLVRESCPSEKFEDGGSSKGRCNSGFSAEG